MEKVKYNIAIQTFMEVFDYLLNNDMLEFDAGEDFLRSRITIGPYGFILETQVARGKWDEEHPNAKLIPAIYVLNYLANNIDEVLRKRNVPVSPSSDYAYINDAQAKLTGYKTYYPSYKELIKKLKEVRNNKETLESTNGRVVDFNVTKLRELSQVFARLTPLEIRTVECYARLEEELINLTAYLLLRDKDNFAVDYPNKEMYDDPDYHLAPTDTSVDWEEFKEYITSEFEFQKEEGKFDLRGAYSSWDENPYISPLGLDGLTR